MRNIRLIARLDVKAPNLVKGIQFEGLRKLGDPNLFARKYYNDGVDEIYYEDIVASLYERNSLVDIVEKTTEEIFVPVTVGGGLRHVDDVAAVLRAGADKVSINTEAIKRPKIIQEVSDRFGSQCLVLSIQAKQQGDRWEAYFDNGRERSGVDVLEWVEYGETSGAGEILLTSVDREGTSRGFDLALTKAVTERVEIPVIASGGMGCDKDLIDVVKVGGVDAVAMAHVLHYEKCHLRNLREKCRAERIPVRVTDRSARWYRVDVVTVIDCGIVNIRNIARALEHVGATVCVSRDVSDVERAKRIVLPGVGAFAPGMKELRDRRLDQAIVSVAHLGIPVLGICLGMQMLFEKSYEKGCHSGLGIIPGTVIPIPRSGPSAETPRKVPHVGWSELKCAPDRGSWDGTILSGTTPGEYVYFVHSFMGSTDETTWPLAQCTYQGLPILAAVEYENITAVQFHPERSGSVGLGILERFLKK